MDIIGNIEFIGKGGVRTECTSEILDHNAPATLDPDQTVLVSYSLTCSDLCPDDTREVKNFIDVQIAGRDKLFHGSGSCFLVEDE